MRTVGVEGHGEDEMTATGEEWAAGIEDKGSRRRPAGPEVHLRYHLPVFSSALCLCPCIRKSQPCCRCALSTRFQGGAATIHLPTTRVDFLPVVVATVFAFTRKITGERRFCEIGRNPMSANFGLSDTGIWYLRCIRAMIDMPGMRPCPHFATKV